MKTPFFPLTLKDYMSSLSAYHFNQIILPPDYEGEIVAHLIEHPENGSNPNAVLYIHGYVDYFFQTHLADWFIENGYDFYALELRKYGNSILPHQKPNNVRDIEEYFEEISLSIQTISEKKSYEKIVLNGHSTGGLITSLYSAFGKERQQLSGLFLNSPFFAFNLSKAFVRNMIPLIARMGRKDPDQEIHAPNSNLYGKSLHKDYFGEWNYNLNWKPISGFPIYAGWINAIYEAHLKVSNGLSIEIPILVLHSSESSKNRIDWDESILITDFVLNIEDIQRKSKLLGNKVKCIGIHNAIHDIFLSRESARDLAFAHLKDWLNQI